MIVLILGGSRSGKSALAERLVQRLPMPVTYVATGRVDDEDFARRVAAHRARRPSSWATVEADIDLAGRLAALRGTVLVDALGSWVARDDSFVVDADGLCRALVARTGDTVLVSDEVGLGVHPATEVGRRFRDALGSVNQAVAEIAHRVLFVAAGRVVDLRPADEVLGW